MAGHVDQADSLVSSVVAHALFARLRSDFSFTATGLVHHSDAGSQYTPIAFSKELRQAGITGSIGTVGDALDNALMESAIGVYKPVLIDHGRSWSGRGEVERETAAYVHWCNTDRLHSSIGYCSPMEYETHYREHVASEAEVALNQVSTGSRAVQHWNRTARAFDMGRS